MAPADMNSLLYREMTPDEIVSYGTAVEAFVDSPAWPVFDLFLTRYERTIGIEALDEEDDKKRSLDFYRGRRAQILMMREALLGLVLLARDLREQGKKQAASASQHDDDRLRLAISDRDDE